MNLNLMRVLVELEEMKKKQEPKNEFFQFVMNLVNGIQKNNVQNYGIFTMVKLTRVKMFAFFQSQTGLS